MTQRQVIQALSGLMLGMFVSILASTVVANALPRIITDLRGSQTVYTWIVTSELLAMTATVPLWGKMADLYSKKLLIQLSLGLFVVGSLIAGLTPNVEALLRMSSLNGAAIPQRVTYFPVSVGFDRGTVVRVVTSTPRNYERSAWTSRLRLCASNASFVSAGATSPNHHHGILPTCAFRGRMTRQSVTHCARGRTRPVEFVTCGRVWTSG